MKGLFGSDIFGIDLYYSDLFGFRIESSKHILHEEGLIICIDMQR